MESFSALLLFCFVFLSTDSSRLHGSRTSFRLDGSHLSYIKFPKWFPCQNGSISFEFETRRSTAMLLYMDDGGISDFLELKLVRGTARLRYNYGNQAIIQTCGDDLNDGNWHKVRIQSSRKEMKVFIDDILQTANYYLRNKKQPLVEGLFTNFLYFGGLPKTWHHNISQEFSLPSVLFEPHFLGSFRNVNYSQCGSEPEKVSVIDSEGVRTSVDDPCAIYNPCQHGGQCISSDEGPVCECDFTEYHGTHCTIGEYFITALFD